MSDKNALLPAQLWRTPLPNRDLTPSHAHRADPGTGTHVVQVGEGRRLPRGGLLRTERIPKDRHLRLTRKWPRSPSAQVRGTGSWVRVLRPTTRKHASYVAIHSPGTGSLVIPI